eukprot:gnl/MRDRNA2_/MRDRNA2_50339_c0_seq1.p2 gnl/MRDRNA2_/MRDRNA2_50339_c0~~gnl/MRDRNA2_/MRDRNA2_50339_c0_seq1.p2  ORF type:complete len:105 (+),score=14.47 gnl/MRDRNA2_/MRDRNA2_50339_c0_seq1:199-513(+)
MGAAAIDPMEALVGNVALEEQGGFTASHVGTSLPTGAAAIDPMEALAGNVTLEEHGGLAGAAAIDPMEALAGNVALEEYGRFTAGHVGIGVGAAYVAGCTSALV